jgi:hypothetical protein
MNSKALVGSTRRWPGGTRQLTGERPLLCSRCPLHLLHRQAPIHWLDPCRVGRIEQTNSDQRYLPC